VSAAPPQERVLETPRIALAARLWGPAEGTRVLALHGWLDNAASFDGIGPRLPGVRLAALDLPGHGRSGHRPGGVPYHFVDYVQDALAAADALGWERFSLLGHSLGAAIASVAAGAVPERIVRLALVEGLGPLAGDPDDAPAQLAASVREAGALAAKRKPVYPDLAAAVRARAEAGHVGEEAARVLCARGVEPVEGGVGWRADARLRVRSPAYLTEPQVRAFLEAIRAPTLLVVAGSGNLVGRAHMPARYAAVRGLERREIPGGHHLHLERPHACAALLAPFLAPG